MRSGPVSHRTLRFSRSVADDGRYAARVSCQFDEALDLPAVQAESGLVMGESSWSACCDLKNFYDSIYWARLEARCPSHGVLHDPGSLIVEREFACSFALDETAVFASSTAVLAQVVNELSNLGDQFSDSVVSLSVIQARVSRALCVLPGFAPVVLCERPVCGQLRPKVCSLRAEGNSVVEQPACRRTVVERLDSLLDAVGLGSSLPSWERAWLGRAVGPLPEDGVDSLHAPWAVAPAKQGVRTAGRCHYTSPSARSGPNSIPTEAAARPLSWASRRFGGAHRGWRGVAFYPLRRRCASRSWLPAQCGGSTWIIVNCCCVCRWAQDVHIFSEAPRRVRVMPAPGVPWPTSRALIFAHGG
ncbi:unnamed protein product [Prorocentrum cordatum]|uniref:Uncharacterized protein n=1 Tax=Prorocentrum cordatum TaxID=2364126 RepID=A0ABN9U3S4_9DINO|nr:unnamed protein product [Polarella glacialis]